MDTSAQAGVSDAVRLPAAAQGTDGGEKVLPNAGVRGRMETAGRITHSADSGVAAGVRAVFRYGGRRCRAAAIPTPGRSVEFPAPWVEWLEEYAMNGRKITGKGLYSG